MKTDPMFSSNRVLLCLIVGVATLLYMNAPVSAQTGGPNAIKQTKGNAKVTVAKGTFEVKMAPVAAEGIAAEAGLGFYSIDKTIHGDLEGTTKGQMMATTVEGGSGAYVALEKVTATLNGRKGTFVLVHRGLMNKGAADLTVTVVPDSGTGELAGLTGTFDIKIEGGNHLYEFSYTLPVKP